MKSFFEPLEFDLPAALLQQLVELFDDMTAGPLTRESVLAIPSEAQGVYQLLMGGEVVYIGKTDDEAGLQKRLLRHVGKITNRRNLDPNLVEFKAVQVYVFTVVDLEQKLIKHYQELGQASSWNNSGFGANDPGRERDTTKLKDDHFDKRYPINIDLPLALEVEETELSVLQALKLLKDKLPYILRFQAAKGEALKDFQLARIGMPGPTATVREILKQVALALGPSWQLTVLPGYVILYKEHKQYPEGEVL